MLSACPAQLNPSPPHWHSSFAASHWPFLAFSAHSVFAIFLLVLSKNCTRERNQGLKEEETETAGKRLQEPEAWKGGQGVKGRAALQLLVTTSSLSPCAADSPGSHCPELSHSPAQTAWGRFLSSLHVSFPCSSCVISFGLENGIPAHQKRKQDAVSYAVRGAPTLRMERTEKQRLREELQRVEQSYWRTVGKDFRKDHSDELWVMNPSHYSSS